METKQTTIVSPSANTGKQTFSEFRGDAAPSKQPPPQQQQQDEDEPTVTVTPHEHIKEGMIAHSEPSPHHHAATADAPPHHVMHNDSEPIHSAVTKRTADKGMYCDEDVKKPGFLEKLVHKLDKLMHPSDKHAESSTEEAAAAQPAAAASQHTTYPPSETFFVAQRPPCGISDASLQRCHDHLRHVEAPTERHLNESNFLDEISAVQDRTARQAGQWGELPSEPALGIESDELEKGRKHLKHIEPRVLNEVPVGNMKEPQPPTTYPPAETFFVAQRPPCGISDERLQRCHDHLTHVDAPTEKHLNDSDFIDEISAVQDRSARQLSQWDELPSEPALGIESDELQQGKRELKPVEPEPPAKAKPRVGPAHGVGDEALITQHCALHHVDAPVEKNVCDMMKESDLVYDPATIAVSSRLESAATVPVMSEKEEAQQRRELEKLNKAREKIEIAHLKHEEKLEKKQEKLEEKHRKEQERLEHQQDKINKARAEEMARVERERVKLEEKEREKGGFFGLFKKKSEPEEASQPMPTTTATTAEAAPAPQFPTTTDYTRMYDAAATAGANASDTIVNIPMSQPQQQQQEPRVESIHQPGFSYLHDNAPPRTAAHFTLPTTTEKEQPPPTGRTYVHTTDGKVWM